MHLRVNPILGGLIANLFRGGGRIRTKFFGAFSEIGRLSNLKNSKSEMQVYLLTLHKKNFSFLTKPSSAWGPRENGLSVDDFRKILQNHT